MEFDQEKYLTLLAEKYPTTQSICREIINLSAILNLPKGTEHFMSDLHGEYEASSGKRWICFLKIHYPVRNGSKFAH